VKCKTYEHRAQRTKALGPINNEKINCTQGTMLQLQCVMKGENKELKK